jgi:hypothetical protein
MSMIKPFWLQLNSQQENISQQLVNAQEPAEEIKS